MNKPILKDAWLADLAAQVEAQGPQRIEVQGRPSLTILSTETFQRLSARKPSLIEALMEGPDLSELDLIRDDRPARDVEL